PYPPGTTAAYFPLGFFRFSVAVGPGQAETLTLQLPSDVPVPTLYWKFGPTPDNSTPHWYNFLFDPQTQTGAVFSGQIDPISGEQVPFGEIVLHFIQGQRGDDSVEDDLIVDAGGPAGFVPAAAVTGSAAGQTGQSLTFTVSAGDLSADTFATGFTYTID